MQFIFRDSRMPIKILTKIQLCRFVLFAKALDCKNLRCLPQTNMGNKLSCGKCSQSKFAPTLVVVGERARESFLEKAFWETEDYFEGKLEQISNCQSALYIISLNSDFKLASSVQIHWNAQCCCIVTLLMRVVKNWVLRPGVLFAVYEIQMFYL